MMFLKIYDEKDLLKNIKFDKRNYQEKTKPLYNGEKKGFRIATRKKSKNFEPVSFNQSVVFKSSYTGARWHTPDFLAENTKNHILYMIREEAIKNTTAFSDKEDDIKEKELLERFEGEKIFKFIISPEKPELANMNYTRKIMNDLKIRTGIDLKWASVIHLNTETPHIHVIVSRECGNFDIDKEHPLYFDRKFIKSAFRKEILEVEATKRLGKVSFLEYQQKYINDIKKIGAGKIDHDIKRLVKDSSVKVSKWKRPHISSRKSFLKKNFKDIVYKQNSNKFKKDWIDNLLVQKKLNDFTFKFDKSKVIVEKPNAIGQVPFKGTVVDMKITDELNERVSFLVIDKSNIPHLVEVKISLSDIKKVLNKEVRISYNFDKPKGYRDPYIAEVEGNKHWRSEGKKQKIGGIKK